MAGSVMGEYTQELYDGIWDIAGRDYEQDYDSGEVLEKLNDPDFFRPFSERLLAFYNEVLNSNYTADEARADLSRRVKQGNIPLNRGNITNWFSGNTEPKYGDNDRKNLFAVAFALELDAKQTEQLFHKVFLDKLTLSMKDPSSYVLRKDIILLYFYDYWVNDYLGGQNVGDYDGFVEGLNDILNVCGFSPLYIGNPYDWLFLYCSACVDDNYTPLDRFRGILTQD